MILYFGFLIGMYLQSQCIMLFKGMRVKARQIYAEERAKTGIWKDKIMYFCITCFGNLAQVILYQAQVPWPHMKNYVMLIPQYEIAGKILYLTVLFIFFNVYAWYESFYFFVVVNDCFQKRSSCGKITSSVVAFLNLFFAQLVYSVDDLFWVIILGILWIVNHYIHYGQFSIMDSYPL